MLQAKPMELRITPTPELIELLERFEAAVVALERIAGTGPLPKPSSSKITFSVAEVAEMTGLSPNTIRKTIQVGKLKAVRLGSRVLVTQKALEEWLEAGSTR